MFGHGQIEGFTERYGMEFKQARWTSTPTSDLVARHQREIAPLLKNRHIFAESTALHSSTTSGTATARSTKTSSPTPTAPATSAPLILYNNSYQSTHGTIHVSVGFLEKSTGSLQQKSLAFGLDLPNDDAVIAYTDTVVGLQYLRYARDLRDSGITVGLRGYQHIALLNWRELRSTASQPWDRLCNTLNGSGVYSIDEALSKLQIQPLLEELRRAVSPENIAVISKLSRELGGPTPPAAQAPPPPVAQEAPAAPKPLAKAKAEPLATSNAEPAIKPVPKPSSVPEKKETATPDLRLNDFIRHAHLFRDRVMELAALDGGHSQYALHSLEETSTSKASTESNSRFSSLIAASVRLPVIVAALPDNLQPSASAVLPSSDPKLSVNQTWGPVLTWVALQTLAPRFSPMDVFEKFNLRWALAETFSSVGLEGEAAWKAAAKVRVLLKFAAQNTSPEILRTEGFWNDPEVRWLAGVHTADNIEYVNQEKFEELLAWFALPALLDIAAATPPVLKDVAQIARSITTLKRLLESVKFDFRQFLEIVTLKP